MKTDELLEKFQMAFDPPSFSENYVANCFPNKFKALIKGLKLKMTPSPLCNFSKKRPF